MRTTLRVIHEDKPETVSDAEQERLWDCFRSAPGVVAVDRIAPDFRGGYVVSIQTADDRLGDRFFSHVVSHGYRLVL